MEYAARGRYFEDFAVGQAFASGGRTIAEADVYAFAGLTGDMNPLHMDEEFAKEASVFKTRVAHGLFGVGLIAGMVYQLGINDGTTLALLETTERFKAPLLIGDTVRAVVKVAKLRPSAKPGRGVVHFNIELVNQRGEVVIEQQQAVLIRARGPAS